jgi:quinol monooxygenase YgiN
MLFVIATLNVDPADRETLIAATRPCLLATRKEAGCISYDFNADVSDEGKLVFVERWQTRDALNAHFKTPHIAAWREIALQLIKSRRIEIIEDAKVEVL